jgi:hypothetical protein
MEYQNIFDILYNILDVIPKDVIETIIFKYAINSNKYIFKYSIPFHTIYNNVHCDKQLGIICCQNDVSTTLIDYNTGHAYNESLINTKTFTTHFTSEHITNKIIYFNNNIIIDQYNDILFKHNYKLSISRCHYNKNDSLVSTYDNHIYVVNNGYVSYSIYKCNTDFDEVCKSINYTFPHMYYLTQMSIYDDMLYICEINKNKLHVSLHNITNLHHIRNIDHELVDNDDLLDRIVYKNKLYELYQFNNNILVYDLITMIHIYTIDIGPEVCWGAKLLIADDILMISDKENTLFYDIIQ